jgi:hypothetical protein
VWKDGNQFAAAQFLSDSEPSESDTQPQPPDDSNSVDENSNIGGWAFECREPVVMDTGEKPPPMRPDWWSDNSSKLAGVSVDGVPHYVQPVCPCQFMEEVHSDIFAFDMSGAQYKTNEVSEEVTHPGPDNNMASDTVVVI